MTTRAHVTRLCRRPGVPSPGPSTPVACAYSGLGKLFTQEPPGSGSPRPGGRGRVRWQGRAAGRTGPPGRAKPVTGSDLVSGQASAGSRTNTGIWRVVFCWYSAYGG
jgi:hypothetical protein